MVSKRKGKKKQIDLDKSNFNSKSKIMKLFAALKRNNLRKISIVLFSALNIIIIVNVIICYYDINQLNQNSYKAEMLSPNELPIHDYEVAKNTYTNTTGSAYFLIPNVDRFVEELSFQFPQTTNEPINIRIFYTTNNDEVFSDQRVITFNTRYFTINDGVILNGYVKNLRVDIGVVNTTFELESITINSVFVRESLIIKRLMRLFIFELCIIALFIVAMALHSKIKKENLYILLALVIGFGYLIAMTPYSQPDSSYHYLNSYSMSSYLLINPESTVYKNHFDTAGFAGHYNTFDGYLRTFREFNMPLPDTPEKKLNDFSFTDFLGKICNIPPAVGIAIARIFKLSFIPLSLLGELTNLLFFILCGYLSIKRLPQYKTTMLLVALAPMALHQATSFSSDNFINGVSLVLFSYLLCAIYEDKPISKADYITICVCTLLLCTIKVIYILIALLFLLIPRQKLKNNGKLKLTIFLGLSAVLMILLSNLNSISGIFFTEASGIDRGYYKLSYFWENPRDAWAIFNRSLFGQLIDNIVSAIGSVFAGVRLALPKHIAISFSIIIILSNLIKDESEWVPKKIDRTLLIFISFSIYFLVYLTMFVGWTPLGYGVIIGVQGRYFTPLIPLMLFAVRGRAIVPTRSLDNLLIALFIALQCRSLVYIINITLE